MKVEKISANLNGRDFICGDIHGHFRQLDQQLFQAGFDPEWDRLFCVGDLIDRHPDSCNVLDFLQRPYVHSILGNHEQMLIDAICNDDLLQRVTWQDSGGEWAKELNDDELMAIALRLCELPVMIEIEMTRLIRVGLVHAALPLECNWQGVVQQVQNIDQGDWHHPIMETLLWDYDQYLERKVKEVTGIHHVFHGHFIMENITTIANHTYLDLGVRRSGKIGLVELFERDERLEFLDYSHNQ